MSGTSLDGVDVSIIESDGNKEFCSILDRYFEYDKEIIQKILNIRDKISSPEELDKHLSEIKDLEREITLFHVKAVEETLDKVCDIHFHTIKSKKASLKKELSNLLLMYEKG